MRRRAVLVGLALLLGCAGKPVSPAEQLARDYTQAFLRRDMAELQELAIANATVPTPSLMLSQAKVVRVCPPTPASGGPQAQQLLILYGNPEAIQFPGMLVTVAKYGDKWLVIDARFSQGPGGQPIIYGRGCNTQATTNSGTRIY